MPQGVGELQLVSLTVGLTTQDCVNYRMTAVPRLSQVQAHYCHRQRVMVFRRTEFQKNPTSGGSTGHWRLEWNYPPIH